MNRFFILLFFLVFTKYCLFSQCYELTRNDGITFYNKANYTRAISCFMAAQRCNDIPENHDLNKWIADCNTKLNPAQTSHKQQEKSLQTAQTGTHQKESTRKNTAVCYAPIYKAALVSIYDNNFSDARELFIEARNCADLPIDNDLSLWIKTCDDQLDFLDCIKENYTPPYLKGNEFYKRGNFEKAKEYYLLAFKSECIPPDLEIYEKIKLCDQNINKKRFNTLLYDTIQVTLWGKEGVFAGYVQFNKPNGNGVFIFKKDQLLSSIEANFSDGKPIDAIHCIFNNQDEFTGMLTDDDFEIGIYKYANGDLYEGSFFQRIPNGEGTVHYANGDIYTGSIVNGKKEGNGKLTIKSDSYITNAHSAKIYEGDWFDNQKSGFGKCFDEENLLIHEGFFTNDFPEKDFPNKNMRIPFIFVKVPEGTFTMGCSLIRNCTENDRPAHTVTLSEFYISEKEVTVAQYRAFCEATGRSMPTKPTWGWDDGGPIVNVTWNDAIAFCQWTNCRLPTEAEWEYAAKGAIEPQQFLYSGGNELREVAYFLDNTTRPKSVGTKKPNELLIYDMSGNVSEWVQDWYGVYPQSPQQNPKGSSSGAYKVVRGGNWLSTEKECRITYRGICEPHFGTSFIGFRVVRK